MPIQIYLKIASRWKFSTQPDEVNIPYDFTSFLLTSADKLIIWYVVIFASNDHLGGVNPKWRAINEFFVKTNLSR